MVVISEIWLRPDGSVKEFAQDVELKVGCGCIGAMPKLGRLSLEEVGVRSGTESK